MNNEWYGIAALVTLNLSGLPGTVRGIDKKAKREGWLGEVEGLQVSLAGAEVKLTQTQRRTVNLGIPTPAPKR